MVGGADDMLLISELEEMGTGAGRRGCGGMGYSSVSRFQSAERLVVATVIVKSLSTESNLLKLPVESK